jgi:hypothetical protein
MTEIYISLGFLLIPVGTILVATKLAPRRLCTVMGISLGLIVSPISLGIYYLGYMIPFIGLIYIVFFAMVLVPHAVAGYEIAAYLFHMKPDSTTWTIERIYVELINGLIWGTFYGIIGYYIDRARKRNKQERQQ